VIGFLVGYTFWGLQVEDLTSALGKTQADLSKTQRWLGEEIRASDERQEQLSAKLNKALADLARTQAQLARISAASRPGPAAAGSRQQPAGARSGKLVGSAF
jgi:predicted  nucleic acid-binding Zn-ribbon protein